MFYMPSLSFPFSFQEASELSIEIVIQVNVSVFIWCHAFRLTTVTIYQNKSCISHYYYYNTPILIINNSYTRVETDWISHHEELQHSALSHQLLFYMFSLFDVFDWTKLNSDLSKGTTQHALCNSTVSPFYSSHHLRAPLISWHDSHSWAHFSRRTYLNQEWLSLKS